MAKRNRGVNADIKKEVKEKKEKEIKKETKELPKQEEIVEKEEKNVKEEKKEPEKKVEVKIKKDEIDEIIDSIKDLDKKDRVEIKIEHNMPIRIKNIEFKRHAKYVLVFTKNTMKSKKAELSLILKSLRAQRVDLKKVKIK